VISEETINANVVDVGGECRNLSSCVTVSVNYSIDCRDSTMFSARARSSRSRSSWYFTVESPYVALGRSTHNKTHKPTIGHATTGYRSTRHELAREPNTSAAFFTVRVRVSTLSCTVVVPRSLRAGGRPQRTARGGRDSGAILLHWRATPITDRRVRPLSLRDTLSASLCSGVRSQSGHRHVSGLGHTTVTQTTRLTLSTSHDDTTHDS
jgi:hypothetical protein